MTRLRLTGSPRQAEIRGQMIEFGSRKAEVGKGIAESKGHRAKGEEISGFRRRVSGVSCQRELGRIPKSEFGMRKWESISFGL